MVIDALEILLVEDNPDHAALTRRALENTNMLNRIHWVKDGQEALDFLFQKGSHVHATRPGLILLDMNLPKVSGLEVLKKIKADETLRIIPVIMLTTSNQDEEARKCYSLGANSFTTKPVKFHDFIEKVRSLKLYWVLTNKTLTSLDA